MNKKFLIKDLSKKKKIINDYLKDLYFENDTFVKLTALDFLSNYLDEEHIEEKLQDLYNKEEDQSVKRAYEKVFSKTFKSSKEISKEKALRLSDEVESQEEKRRLTNSLNNQLKYFKTKI